MPVELRARCSRPSYKTMLELPDNEEGPLFPEDDGASSESSFELPNPEKDRGRAGDEDAETEVEKVSVQDEYDIVPGPSNFKVKGNEKGKDKWKRTAAATRRPATASLHRAAPTVSAPGLPRPTTRQHYALPLPNFNHRHRGAPVYLPPLRTHRLATKPSMFSHSETVLTTSIADPVVRERVSKATSHNIGRGPLWELMEDLSWFKECPPGDQTRPIVYTTIHVDGEWELLSQKQASPYIPKGVEGLSQSPMTCFFGPRDNQTKVQLDALQTYKMAHVFPESMSHIFYAGAPVWAIDWCPVFVSDLPYRDYKQYVAVAPFPSYSHSPEVGRRVTRPSPASIQIWSLSPAQRTSDSESMDLDQSEDSGVMKCELILCIDSGPAHELKWCPLPSHDEHSSSPPSGLRKLGLLGGTFEDGSVSFYVVPNPNNLISSEYRSGSPHHVKLSPSLRIELEGTMCWSMDWANSELVAVGCTNGSIAIFRVKDALEHRSHQQALRPTHYFTLHQSAIRSVSWIRVPPTSASGMSRPDRDPTIILSGGYDGAQMVADIRDLRGNIMNRTRDVINSIVFSNHVGGPLASDHENLIKKFGITPNTLGRGHGLMEPSGPAWSIATSDFHPQLAVGSADGSCRTTNMMKSTRRSGAVPFFIYKIFQVDYNRMSGEYRMLENFLPYEHQDRPTASRGSKTKKEVELPVSTGAWSPEVSVTRVTWQSGSGLAKAPLLASATASGLCRIDWLLGRFNKDRVPYQNIETLRGEIEGVVDEDAEED